MPRYQNGIKVMKVVRNEFVPKVSTMYLHNSKFSNEFAISSKSWIYLLFGKLQLNVAATGRSVS